MSSFFETKLYERLQIIKAGELDTELLISNFLDHIKCVIRGAQCDNLIEIQEEEYDNTKLKLVCGSYSINIYGKIIDGRLRIVFDSQFNVDFVDYIDGSWKYVIDADRTIDIDNDRIFQMLYYSLVNDDEV